MSQKTLHLHGVIERSNITGTIDISELVANFDSDWLPEYQRVRVNRRQKISSLKTCYKNMVQLPALTLNLSDGDFKETSPNHFELVGQFHLIDGQQRLLAARDAAAAGYGQKVDVFIGLSYDEEHAKFLNLNEDQTRVSVATIIKGYRSPLSDLLRRVVACQNYPVKISLGSCSQGLHATSYCQILYWVYHMLKNKKHVPIMPSSTSLKAFMRNTEISGRDLSIVEFAMRNLFEENRRVFGTYSHKATAYRRPFLMGWDHIIIDNWMSSTGNINPGKFKEKLGNISNIIKNSELLEKIGAGHNTLSHLSVYRMLLRSHFNYRMQNKIEYPYEEVVVKEFEEDFNKSEAESVQPAYM